MSPYIQHLHGKLHFSIQLHKQEDCSLLNRVTNCFITSEKSQFCYLNKLPRKVLSSLIYWVGSHLKQPTLFRYLMDVEFPSWCSVVYKSYYTRWWSLSCSWALGCNHLILWWEWLFLLLFEFHFSLHYFSCNPQFLKGLVSNLFIQC